MCVFFQLDEMHDTKGVLVCSDASVEKGCWLDGAREGGGGVKRKMFILSHSLET